MPVAIQPFIIPEMLKKQWVIIKEGRSSTIIVRLYGQRKTVPTDNYQER